MKAIWHLPCLSQEIEGSPSINVCGDIVTIAFEFFSEEGELKHVRFGFNGVEAVLYTQFDACRPDQVDAYDKVICKSESELLESHQSRKIQRNNRLRHFEVFFDETGCVQIIAEEFFLN